MSNSLLVRRPALSRHLGPVVAADRRLASRYSNSLRAGAAGGVEDLRGCGLILMQPGSAGADRLVALLREAGPWKGTHFALLSADEEASALGELRAGGAVACSVAALPARSRDVVVLEGDRRAVRRARQWLAEGHMRCLDLAPGGKPLVLLGMQTAAGLVTPLLDAALMTLRAAGIGSREARRLLQDTADAAVRAFAARGRHGWENPAAAGRAPLTEARLAAAAQIVPELASFQALVYDAVRQHYASGTGAGEGKDSGVPARAGGIR